MGKALNVIAPVAKFATGGALKLGKSAAGGFQAPAAPGLASPVIKTGDEGRQVMMDDFQAGSKIGKDLIQPGSLGRLGELSDIKTALSGARELAGGLSAPEMQAQRDVASQNINTSTEQARRRLAAAQARAGVRGATAGAQQAGIIGQGIQAQQGLERDLLLRNREAKSQGIQQLSQLATGVGQFDLSQAAREKFAPISTGLAFSQLGATQRGTLAAAQASTNAANAQIQANKPGLLGSLLGGIL